MIKYKEFRTLQEAEFELLEELDGVKSIINIAERNSERLKKIFESQFILIEIIKTGDINILAKKLLDSYGTIDSYITFQNESNLNINVGEIFILFIDRYGDDIEKILKIQKDVLEDAFLEDMSKKSVSINKKNLNKFTITKDKIKNLVNVPYSKRKNLEKEEEKEESDRKTSKEKETKKRKIEFENNCVGKFGELEINKNKIIRLAQEYILKKNINKVFDFDYLDIRSRGSYGNNLTSIKNKLIEKRENYTKRDMLGSKKWVKTYNIEFEKEKDIKKKQILRKFDEKRGYKGWIKVNGIKVSENKLNKVLDSITEKTTKEQIEYINKYSGMKVEAITLKSINTENNTNIEINISPIKQDKFIIDFLSNKKEVDWDFIKKYFFFGGGSRRMSSYMRIKSLLEFVGELGLTKADLFTHLKRERMLKKLK